MLKRSQTNALAEDSHGSRFELSEEERNEYQSRMEVFLKDLKKFAAVQDDYTVSIRVDHLPSNLSEVPWLSDDSILRHEIKREEEEEELPECDIKPLHICILIVGTRGDVQPFVAIGKRLQKIGHRVRLATHKNFREFVMGEGLEFFPLGGDPKVLAEYMVKNKGFLPSGPSEVFQQRKQLKEIIESTWPACTEADKESGGQPFTADAIIANPPTIVHASVAEKLEVPLHVFFTMPWTATKAYPHPLARISGTSGDQVSSVAGLENRFSYFAVDQMMWLGMADMVNDFRKNLGLPSIGVMHSIHRPRNIIPYGYIWSPSLAPKPSDWGSEIEVCGFCFLTLASNYSPPPELVDFFNAGDPPIFIGFGSLPVQDPAGMTHTIVEALRQTGQRGIIQKGWGGLGELDVVPDHVFTLGNCPHDWLFPQCRAVIHHGGAGTTAAGLIAACPTTIVPFFGDQPFWGGRVHAENVGPEPIPSQVFTLERLVHAINFMLRPQVKEAAEKMAEKMQQENGVEGAVRAFHKHLPRNMHHGLKATPWLLKREEMQQFHSTYLPHVDRSHFQIFTSCCRSSSVKE